MNQITTIQGKTTTLSLPQIDSRIDILREEVRSRPSKDELKQALRGVFATWPFKGSEAQLEDALNAYVFALSCVPLKHVRQAIGMAIRGELEGHDETQFRPTAPTLTKAAKALHMIEVDELERLKRTRDMLALRHESHSGLTEDQMAERARQVKEIIAKYAIGNAVPTDENNHPETQG